MDWVPINDYPGDQQYDGVPSELPYVSFWGEIGVESAGKWSWTIMAHNDACDSWQEDGGIVGSEAEAKATVEAWRKL